MQICHKEITVVYFHPLFASHPFTLLPSLHGSIQGRIQDFNKGGGGGTKHCLFVLTAASLESRASPKKALISGGGGGGLRPFFRSATSVESRASPKRGGGIRHISVFRNIFFYVSKGGGAHVQKRGRKLYKNVSRGARAGCAPPPKSATGSIHPCPNHNDDYCVENLMPFHGTNFSLTGGGGNVGGWGALHYWKWLIR